MILIGQFDSPFVRRVAIALDIYGMPFEHRPWSVFGDADRIAAFNPLLRVPTLVLDDGEVLIESFAVLDALDQMAIQSGGAGSALLPPSGAERRHALKVCALATGLADKAVSMVYERAVHERATPAWIDRCKAQIGAVLEVLEADRELTDDDWWFGPDIGHADIAVGVALFFLADAHPGLFALADWPRLAQHSARCEAMAPFAARKQPFKVTLPSAS